MYVVKVEEIYCELSESYNILSPDMHLLLMYLSEVNFSHWQSYHGSIYYMNYVHAQEPHGILLYCVEL